MRRRQLTKLAWDAAVILAALWVVPGLARVTVQQLRIAQRYDRPEMWAVAFEWAGYCAATVIVGLSVTTFMNGRLGAWRRIGLGAAAVVTILVLAASIKLTPPDLRRFNADEPTAAMVWVCVATGPGVIWGEGVLTLLGKLALWAWRLRKRKRVAQGLCGKCGYSLRGLPENGRLVCPECGTGVAVVRSAPVKGGSV